jgi:outer membrane receptor protein involved in Fe transport
MNPSKHAGAYRLALYASSLSLLALGTSNAFAQASSDTENIEEIVVTGSHIKRDTFNYSTPITVLDAGQIEATGSTNLGDLLQTVPQAVSTFNNANTAFSTTFSGVNLTDLRFLGTARTLVLVNGRRFVSGAPPGGGYGVDLNAIPTAMIERIEVLTGGASAIYGSDAIAGVVNIVTRTDFEGVKINGQVGASTQGDKNKEDITISTGGEFGDGGFAMLSVGWSSDDALRSRDRSFSDTDLAAYDLDGDGFAETEAWLGSSFPPAGRLNPSGPADFLGDGNVFRSGLADRANSDRFNRADYRTIYSPVDRRFASANASYPLNDSVNFFTEFNYALVETNSEIEPFALDINDDIFISSRGGTGGLDVAGNLLMPQLLQDNLLAAGVTNTAQLGTGGWVRRLVEFGPRASDVTRTTLRGLAGFDFALPNGWELETYYSYGKTDQDQENTGQINTERALQAFNVELASDGTTVQCADQVARLQGCVPFNVFGAGTISPAAVAYLSAPGNLQSKVEQEILHIGLSGNTGLELSGGPLAFATGFEYREETGAEINPGFLQRGISGGNATAPTNGSFDVTEWYGEVSVPVHDRLVLDAAVRVGDYSTVGNQTTWKAGFDWDLHETLRLRGTVSESVRAPNVADLFAGAGETFRNVQDPCNGIDNTTTGDVAENCRSIQVIQDRIDATGSFTLTQAESQQTGGFIGGNPDVGEETAEAFTVGLVWRPNFLPNFRGAFDYYDIKLDDAIAITSRNTVLNRCYNVAPSAFDPTCSARARRDMAAGAGALVGVDSASSNENIFDTQGLDIELGYNVDIGTGNLDFGILWNHLFTWDEIGIFDGDVDDNVGEILTPDDRATGHVAYNWGNWNAYWRFRYWGRSKDSNTPLLQDENGGVLGNPLAPNINEVASYVYNDLSLGWADGSYAVVLGLINAGDKQPPLLTQTSQYGTTGVNTAPEAYDTIGRQWYVSFTYSTD